MEQSSLSQEEIDATMYVTQLKEHATNYSTSQGSVEARERLIHMLQSKDSQNILSETNTNSSELNRAFQSAVYHNHIDVMQALVEKGKNVNTRSRSGQTALSSACHRGSKEIVGFLLDHDANINVQDNLGFTPLIIASMYGHVQNVQRLLEKNADPDIQTYNEGMTALMYASDYGFHEIVQLLLSYNANADLKKTYGGTALEFSGSAKVEDLLRNHVSSSYVLK